MTDVVRLKFGLRQLALTGCCLVCWNSLAQAQASQSGFLSSNQKLPDRKDNAVAPSEIPQQNQDSSPQASSAAQPLNGKTRNSLIRFVRKHHPELERLLNSLKAKRPEQYQAALRSLNQSVKALNNIKAKQSAQRYEQALEDWKLRSRIQLLSAQLSITDTPAKRKELSKLIARRLDNRINQVNGELEKSRDRVERLESIVSELRSNRDAEVERQLENAIRIAKRVRLARERESKKANSGKSSSGRNKKPVDPDASSQDRAPNEVNNLSSLGER
jgi:hypothetical protein